MKTGAVEAAASAFLVSCDRPSSRGSTPVNHSPAPRPATSSGAPSMISLRRSKRDLAVATGSAAASASGSVSGSGFAAAGLAPAFFPAIALTIASQGATGRATRGGLEAQADRQRLTNPLRATF